MSEPVVATADIVRPTSQDASVNHWAGLTRWRDWAHSKLPFAGAAALLLGLSPTHTLFVLATVGLCAAFGYGVNEIADAVAMRAWASATGRWPSHAGNASPLPLEPRQPRLR